MIPEPTWQVVCQSIQAASPEQRQELVDRLDLLVGPRRDQSTDRVVRLLRNVTPLAIPVDYVLKRTAWWPRWVNQAKIFWDFVSEVMPEVRRRDQIAIIFFQAIEANMKRKKIPMGLKTFGQAMERIDQISDEEFPGYRQSNLFRHLPQFKKAFDDTGNL